MIGYVFIRSGAIWTAQPELYPARNVQIERLKAASQSIGSRLEMIIVEKCHTITGIRSLPKLLILLRDARKKGEQVYIDDFRRIFLACPFEKRIEFLKEFLVVGDTFWESRAGRRPFTSLSVEDLVQLVVVRPRDVSKKKAEGRTVGSRKRQTSNARLVSIRMRAAMSDISAKQIQDLRDEMIAKEPTVTLKTIVSEATKRELTTSRGNPWSVSSVHRALRRNII